MPETTTVTTVEYLVELLEQQFGDWVWIPYLGMDLRRDGFDTPEQAQECADRAEKRFSAGFDYARGLGIIEDRGTRIYKRETTVIKTYL